jgi:hypothetical protein
VSGDEGERDVCCDFHLVVVVVVLPLEGEVEAAGAGQLLVVATVFEAELAAGS